jgi:protein SCO1/2
MADWQQSGPDAATADAEDRAGTPAADPPIRRPRWAFPLLFVVVFGLGLAALVGLWRAGLLPGNDGGFRGFVMSPPRPAPAIPLATSAGEPFSLEAARGRVVMLFFGYTYCPDVCPMALGRMAAALDVLGADADRVLPVFVSVDPERDTPQVLDRYTKAIHPRIVGVTGDDATLREIARSYNVAYERDPVPAGASQALYTITHSSTVFLVDPQGRLRAGFLDPYSAEDLAHDVRLLLGGG